MSGKVERGTHPVEGMDIAEVLTSAGPVVKCVILRATTSDKNGDTNEHGCSDDNDNVAKKSTASESVDKEASNGTAVVAEENPESKLQHERQQHGKVVLEHLIDEVEIDTTPSKSMVSTFLGGPFTFLGQYEEEGIVLMVRSLPDEVIELRIQERDDDAADAASSSMTSLLKEKKMSELKVLCQQLDIDMAGMLEKSDVVKAIESKIPPLNPHVLQPPLNQASVCGDIVCMKVAETNEELDNIDDDDIEIELEEEDEDVEKENEEGNEEADKAKSDEAGDETDETNDAERSQPEESSAMTKLHVPSNDEFFLNYTKEEYIIFASRTDIKEEGQDIENAEEVKEGKEKAGEEETGSKDGDNNDDEEGDGSFDDDDPANQEEEEDGDEPVDRGDDGAYVMGGDETIDDEDKGAMFNLVMNEVLRQYREENGRGPNTQELLELRSTIAKELDVEVAHIEDSDWDKKAKETTSKKIGFHEEDKVLEYHPHENEHNHHFMMEDSGGHYLDDDEDDDADEEEDDNYEPPNKRFKRDPNDDDEDEKKPAAVENGISNGVKPDQNEPQVPKEGREEAEVTIGNGFTSGFARAANNTESSK